ncbi:MAG TPA: YceI family protein [Thermomicrobiales bacterium]|nr:YceI family protein [Thermomicrobiales bacterium]
METQTQSTTTTGAGVGVTTWTLDPAHTLVEFGVKHMMFTTVKGRFPGVSGTFTVDEANPANSSTSVTIDTASIDTRDEKRDAHLRSADFFDVENYPTITFESTRVEPHGKDKERATIYGNLTIRGVTREVALDAAFNGKAVTPWGNEISSYSATTSIDRKDYGLTWNAALEAGGMLVGDTIKITIEVEATK